MTPDPYQATATSPSNPGDPQSWNRYTYADHDPVSRVDASGLFSDGSDRSEQSNACVNLQPSGYVSADSRYPPGACITIAVPWLLAAWELINDAREAAAERKQSPPECFAQLKNRDVDDPKAELFNAQHSFWWIQDSTGANYIISAGPQPVPGSTTQQYLDVWPIPGQSNGKDNISAHTQWSSGLSIFNCDLVDRMLAAARAFPKDRIYYDAAFGPNSNSAAHYLANAAGFNPTVPFNFYGWNTEILVP